jgi:hypothetical protein
MLLEMDLNGGRSIETGSFSALPDGTFVRDITATYAEGTGAIGVGAVGPEGYVGHFRQTFAPNGPNEMRTSVMRRAADGTFVPTFPGSDRMIMRRAA